MNKPILLTEIRDERGVLIPIEEKDLPFKVNHLKYITKQEIGLEEKFNGVNLFVLILMPLDSDFRKEFSYLVLNQSELQDYRITLGYSGLLLWYSEKSPVLSFNEVQRHLTRNVLPEGLVTSIPRLFFVTNVPEGITRGEHAHRTGEQILVLLKGCCKVNTVSSTGEVLHELSDKNSKLYLPSLTWVSLFDFSKDAVLMVLCNESFDKQAYLRSFSEFLSIIRK